jgi:four helix bundle protein
MLRIYDVMVKVLEELRNVLPQIGRRDRSLEDQLRRAATSVLLNLAEGSGARGGNRTLRYCTALGSARECDACLRAAGALGYIGSLEPSLVAGLREVTATLVKVTR